MGYLFVCEFFEFFELCKNGAVKLMGESHDLIGNWWLCLLMRELCIDTLCFEVNFHFNATGERVS